MNIKEGIEKRFSVRAFTDQVPSIELIKEILKTAGSAPSGGNIQPWKVYVLNENAKKSLSEKTLHNFDNGVQEEIEYEIYPKPLADEYKKRRYECGADMYIDHLEKMDGDMLVCFLRIFGYLQFITD